MKNQIEFWSVIQISAGQIWEEYICCNLCELDIVIFLLIPGILSSQSIFYNEIRIAFEIYLMWKLLLFDLCIGFVILRMKNLKTFNNIA